jgi:signal transduction histidine kinase/DNA-binding NarL/FixJ family response regulator
MSVSRWPTSRLPGAWLGSVLRSVLRSIFLLSLLLGSWSSAAAVHEDGMDGTDGVDLARPGGQIQLVQQLSLLKDRSGQLDLAAALARTDWHAATLDTLNRGFTASTFWLQGTLYNSSDRPLMRWLSVGAVRLEDVRYFRFTPGEAAPRETLLGGTREPLDSRPVRAALSVFPVKLAAGERMHFALRIQSRSAVDMTVKVWRPSAFRSAEERALIIKMLLVGAMFTVALYTLMLGLIRHDRVFLLLTGAVVAVAIYDLAFQGYLYRYHLIGNGELALRMPVGAAAVAIPLFSAMMMMFVEIDRIAFWKWVYRTIICATPLIGLWTAFGDYRTSAVFMLGVILVCNIAWPVSMIDGWRRGFANARLLMLSFVIACPMLFVRLAMLQGVLAEKWVVSVDAAWGDFSMLVMMALIVIGRSRQLQKAQQQTQQDLLDAKAWEHERLERAVVERTQALQAALIAADEAKGAQTDFLARISHDLRTPLTSIIGFSDLVQAGGREDAERGRIIRRSANHMLAMVNDLIEYAGGADPDALRLEPVYIHALLDAIVQEGASLAGKRGNRFVSDICGELPAILELDGKRIRQVLGNLIDNATKFTRRGTVTLSVDCRAGAAPGMPVTLMFSVKDTGYGIAAEDQEHIFEPFLRLDAARRQPGVGLGLAIVRQWISLMGGTLVLQSALGAGTTVSISLRPRPLEEANVTQHYVSDAIGMLPSIDGSGLRIWIAEDTAEILQLLNDDLSSLGFIVETASDGTGMIQRIMQPDGPAPDLLLTDHMMPGADGMAVLAAARRYRPALPVVALSAMPQTVGGRGNNGSDRDSDAPGYDACLLKPVNLVDLHNTLARLLKLTRVPSADIALNRKSLIRPATHILAETQRLIELGAISDLIDWAENLAARDPQCGEFALKVRHFARLGDLVELQSLCRA